MNNIKADIDCQLQKIVFTDEMFNNTLYCKKGQNIKVRYAVAAIAAICCLTGITSYAVHIYNNRVMVNETEIPALNDMSIYHYNPIKEYTAKDDFGITKKYKSYQDLKNEIAIPILESKYAEGNDKMLIELTTDEKNYESIHIAGFIIGDVENLEPIAKGHFYSYTPGNEFYSPVNLDIDIILSEEQLYQGLEFDYLGGYEFVEQYISTQGYKVNIVATTGSSVPSYSAIFVSDGIRYKLDGKIELEQMKEIVDSMK